MACGDATFFCASGQFHLAKPATILLRTRHVMAAIGRFQKGDDIFYAKVEMSEGSEQNFGDVLKHLIPLNPLHF